MSTTLYRVYDAADRLLYVGITEGAFLRLGAHADNAAWAAHAATITLERYGDRETAAAAELSEIRDEDPVWNINGRPYERFVQWMAAYPDKHADEIDTEKVARELLAAFPGPDVKPPPGGAGGGGEPRRVHPSALTRQHDIASRAVDWFAVYQFTMPLIERLGPLPPWPGTVSWCELSDHDPAKLGAVLVAGMLWALNEDARQEAMAEASKAISASADWGRIGQQIQNRAGFYRQRPWLKRRTAS